MENKKFRVIFAGTIDISVEILAILLSIKDIEVVGVICQPDAFIGREKILRPCPVKAFAMSKNILVFSPLKTNDIYTQLQGLAPDFLVTCAFGQFIPERVLNLFKDSVNVHGSLLPLYRGGSPLQAAIRNGDEESGVSLMRMVKAMDAGPVFCQARFKIDDDENSQTIFDKATKVGAKLIKENIIQIFKGKISPVAQEESKVTFAYNLKNNEEHIDFTKSAVAVVNFVKSLTPTPIPFCFFDKMRIKIAKIEVVENLSQIPHPLPGTIVDVDKKGIIVACGEKSYVRILEIQKEGKKMQAAHIYYKNRTIFLNNKVFS